jgi:phosphoglycerol transferase MdoB-like AlkP superfamily enzyme
MSRQFLRGAATPGFPALIGVTFLLISTLTRLALSLLAGTTAVPVHYWPGIFLRGLGFDLAVLAWFLMPVLLLRAALPERFQRGRGIAWLRMLAYFCLVFLLLFGAVAEWTFWEEFSSRFNFIAVDYLVYTHEVIGNIVESYPVAWIVTALAALAAAVTWAARRRLLHGQAVSGSWRMRVGTLLLAVLLPAAGFVLTDIGQMEHSDNVYANELSGNGLMTFFAAFRRNELDYERFYLTLPNAEEQRILGRLGVERIPVSAALQATEGESEAWDGARLPLRRPPRNIVLISVESLSAEFVGAYGDKHGLTPRLDRLAREGLMFSRAYATGTRTVRGLEALSLGTPPIPGQAIVRRPNNDKLATLGEILRQQGYESLFIYGGHGYFDNMNAYFSGNDYRVVDRTDFPKASIVFANIWGVADESLYANALTELDRAHGRRKPFIAHVMTTSNHRPFTYPDGRIDIPSPGKRPGAVKYTDYAIGRFIDLARNKPWFRDTLFVITADHCASAAGKTRLPVKGYHIPLILYGPDLVKPGRIDRLVSQLDIPPTLLDLLGKPGDDHFFGKSVFEQTGEAPRAFISNYQALGYYKNDRLTVLSPGKRAEAYRIDTATGEATPMATDPQLLEEAVAYYQQAFRAFKQGELKLKSGMPGR